MVPRKIRQVRLGISIGITLCILSDTAGKAGAVRYYPAEGVIGRVQVHAVKANESLLEIARKYGLGYNEITDANPAVDPFVPLPGTSIVIPTVWILPEVRHVPGMVVNLAELRLYCFSCEAAGTVTTFPLGIGAEGKDTPLGTFTVTQKLVDPPWFVPESIRNERTDLAEIVPPGADNPIGPRALRLSLHDLMIHGTNRPWGIGRRSSHGCLRLYPEDMLKLFALVRKGSGVTILNQPVKAAVKGGRVLLEVHRYGELDYLIESIDVLREKLAIQLVDFAKLRKVLEEKRGIPLDITLEESTAPSLTRR